MRLAGLGATANRRALRALDPPNPVYDELRARLAADLEALKPRKPATKTAEKTTR